MSDRDRDIDTIQRELTAFARRARAQAGRMHPELSLVTYTILNHLREEGGCRGTDLAIHFMLDKSTVSRQVAALDRLGLIERTPDPDDQRGQIIRPSEAGERLLNSVLAQRRQIFRSRLESWTEEDLADFAVFLHRFNAGA
ncbi:MarR family winged helix-turn-helix transcriptional regulator [Phaeacidiphilus oryzae]|uniref:MarR family winged helix-turn-helix transcriptional regulator n=1 Tax=Phaeacidiphilus oryzae TaxID=348818 RepID=UPI0005696018|nr:MarR family transcriptional regulator [Phaeacidiphilus oryzae]